MNEDPNTKLAEPEVDVYSRRLVQRVPGFLVDRFFSTLSALGKRTPPAVKRLKALEKTINISYGPHGQWNTLDIYKLPSERQKRPVMLYVHGGAFRALSKDTHWLMAHDTSIYSFLPCSRKLSIAKLSSRSSLILLTTF